MKQPNITTWFLLLLFLTILLSTCGLYSYPYIFSPTVSSAVTGSSAAITVRNNDGNDADVFQGYEIYYKFYQTGPSTAAMANDDKSLFDKEEPEPTDITRLGFRRVETTEFYTINRVVQRTPTPMILVNSASRTNPFTFVINFAGVDTGSNQVIPSVTSVNGGHLGNEGVKLYRPIQLETSDNDYVSTTIERKSFIVEDLSSSNSDMSGISTVTLSLYIFAYGKYDRVYDIYSKPVLLGHIDY